MDRIGSTLTLENVFVVLAFIMLPIGFSFIMVLSDFPGDVINGKTLRLYNQATSESTIYTCCGLLCIFIVCNIIRTVVKVHTDTEIALHITHELYQQSKDNAHMNEKKDYHKRGCNPHVPSQTYSRHPRSSEFPLTGPNIESETLVGIASSPVPTAHPPSDVFSIHASIQSTTHDETKGSTIKGASKKSAKDQRRNFI
uniref:Uncharacterized protein n=1 Tax=Panagrellus redivivus TaxID=6233 RepID=A0A7E4VX28_PANRE